MRCNPQPQGMGLEATSKLFHLYGCYYAVQHAINVTDSSFFTIPKLHLYKVSHWLWQHLQWNMKSSLPTLLLGFV